MERREIGEGYGSIMVLVPHQDDEILLCAGIIESAVKNGVDITVVMATNGDYGSRDLSIGQARLRETLEGLGVLGVSENQVVFLGFADTGMPEEDSFLYRLYQERDGNRVHPSCCEVCTYGLPEKEEFHKKEYGEHGTYTRNVFLEDLKAVLMKYRPEHIFTTSPEDTHGDHKGLFLFVQEVLGECRKEGYAPKLYAGLVHSRAGDENWPEQTCGIVPLSSPECAACARLTDKECADNGEEGSGSGKRRDREERKEGEERSEKEERKEWEEKGILGSLVWEDRIVFPVPESMRTENMRENKKAQALSKHVTALKPDAVDFLYAFVKADEVFWEMAQSLQAAGKAWRLD